MSAAEPVADFRAQHNLPDKFGVTHFVDQPYAYNRLWRDQAVLSAVREQLLQAVPMRITIQKAPEVPDMIATVFHVNLVSAAADYEPEMDAVEAVASDMRDFLVPAVYKLINLHILHRRRGDTDTQVAAEFDMTAEYEQVLAESVRVEATAHPYTTPDGRAWQAAVVHNLFGPAGLQIDGANDQQWLVADDVLAFPAAAWMRDTCLQLGERIRDRFENG